MLEVRSHNNGATAVVAASGELDLASARRLADALAAAPAMGATDVVLDLRGLEFIDSSGIGVVLRMQRHFAVEGIGFGLVRGGDAVQRAFELSHVDALMPWTEPPAEPA